MEDKIMIRRLCDCKIYDLNNVKNDLSLLNETTLIILRNLPMTDIKFI